MSGPSASSGKPLVDVEHLPTLFGHPTGLFMLFFAEMWERFSYYGMRALLVFYMSKGFLGYNDDDAYKIYGAYVALVYMTPFFGGILADRLLGTRRAVVFGGLLMAGGHLLMTIENAYAFYGALALLICGNGFFKPNISTIVGSLYAEKDPRRDGGFTLFYMGINLGAAMAPLLCGYVGETYGWHYGFGLATAGMLVGLAVFIVPTAVAQALILGGAVLTAVTQVWLQGAGDIYLLSVNVFVAAALIVAGVVAFRALSRGGLPGEAGQPPSLEALERKIGGVLKAEHAVYLGTLAVVPVFALLVWSNRTFYVIPKSVFEPLKGSSSKIVEVAGSILAEMSTLPGLLVVVTGIIGVGYLLWESFRSDRIERQRLWVVVTMLFFSMLFWAFFEQAGSSINNFTDRNVDRVTEERVLTAADVGQILPLTLTQDQLGYPVDGEPLTLTRLGELREAKADNVELLVGPEHVGMGVGGPEIPASTFQAANPIFILLFGLVFTAMWGFLGRRGLEPSTPVKFALGLGQLSLGFVALWWGAQNADSVGMVGMSWLLIGYLLHTTGELCLSPVGLSMVTRLSPARLVSTAMGAWFLATAFSGLLAGIIATFTGVGHGGGDESAGIPVPLETVHVYGDVFYGIAVAAGISTIIAFALAPVLRKWMHEEAMHELGHDDTAKAA